MSNEAVELLGSRTLSITPDGVKGSLVFRVPGSVQWNPSNGIPLGLSTWPDTNVSSLSDELYATEFRYGPFRDQNEVPATSTSYSWVRVEVEYEYGGWSTRFEGGAEVLTTVEGRLWTSDNTEIKDTGAVIYPCIIIAATKIVVGTKPNDIMQRQGTLNEAPFTIRPSFPTNADPYTVPKEKGLMDSIEMTEIKTVSGPGMAYRVTYRIRMIPSAESNSVATRTSWQEIWRPDTGDWEETTPLLYATGDWSILQ